jgi:hypothetical protein
MASRVRENDASKAITATRKHLRGRINDKPSTKRQKHVKRIEPNGGYVGVRLYHDRLAWGHIREAQVPHNIIGEIDLKEIGKQLGVGKCCVRLTHHCI